MPPRRTGGCAGWTGGPPATPIFLDSEVRFPARVERSARYRGAEPGRWGLAVLSRLPVRESEVIPLQRLRRDRANRAVMARASRSAATRSASPGPTCRTSPTGRPCTGGRSPAPSTEIFGNEPVLLAGDMNLWGPPIHAFLGPWRRAVKGKTWPSWRPHSQLDHVLVRGLKVLDSGVWPESGSDHRPVWARLALET